MPEATMQAQIVRELAARFWLIDHSRPGLDMSPKAIVGLMRRMQNVPSGDPYRWLERELAKRYRTTLQGHGGKPDLLLTRPAGGRDFRGMVVPSHTIGRAVHAELKTLEGKVTDDQLTWLLALADSGAEVWLVDPSNLADFYAALVPLDSPPAPGLHLPEGRNI